MVTTEEGGACLASSADGLRWIGYRPSARGSPPLLSSGSEAELEAKPRQVRGRKKRVWSVGKSSPKAGVLSHSLPQPPAPHVCMPVEPNKPRVSQEMLNLVGSTSKGGLSAAVTHLDPNCARPNFRADDLFPPDSPSPEEIEGRWPICPFTSAVISWEKLNGGRLTCKCEEPLAQLGGRTESRLAWGLGGGIGCGGKLCSSLLVPLSAPG